MPAGHLCTRGSSWHSNVKNCEGSEVLLYLQANQVACQSFLDAGRRYETPVLDTKEFIFYSGSSGQSISMFFAVFLSLSSQRTMERVLGDICICSGLYDMRGTLRLGNLSLL